MSSSRKYAVALLILSYALILHPAVASSDAKVYPVRGFFFDESSQSQLDPEFLNVVKKLTVDSLSDNVYSSLNAIFKGRVEALNQSSANHTFAVSFHVTRAISYKVDKGNGLFDLITPVTASIYFTNVVNGEIFTTISRTNIGGAVVSNTENVNAAIENLFSNTIKGLITSLADEAGKNFSPFMVEAKVTDQVGDLLVLDSGYGKGVQVGDSLEDDTGQLINIVYSAQSYCVAERILADKVGSGSVFHKYLSHKSDGKNKPRTIVLVEKVPSGYSKQYVAQLFSDLVGDKAPLSIVQINPGFTNLRQSILQKVQLSISNASRRKTPDLFIRLRIDEPIMYEARTNLEFKTIRNYKGLAFADVIDVSKRVNYSAIGKDKLEETITNGISPSFNERREVVIKNALMNLANNLAKLGDVNRDQTPIESKSAGELSVSNSGKAFFQAQKGLILHRTKVQLGNGSQDVLIPVIDAVIRSNSGSMSSLEPGVLPINTKQPNPVTGDVFEVERLGTTPRSSYYFSLCPETENLGTLKTPSLADLTSSILGMRMPGVFYAPSISEYAREIGPAAGFSEEVHWKSPQINLCVQPVDRVSIEGDKCDKQCQKSIFAKYTLRVKAGDQIISRTGTEEKFTTTGFYNQTPPDQINKLIDSDIVDEAEKLISKAAETLSFTAK